MTTQMLSKPRAFVGAAVLPITLLAILLTLLQASSALAHPAASDARPDNILRLHSPEPEMLDPARTAQSKESTITSGSTFAFAMSADAVGLDPALVTDGGSFQVTNQIYETLVKYQPGDTTPVPGLAESWAVSSDGLTWTFTLRPGVKFHDGTDLNAAAVQYNLERWWDPAHPYHNGSFDYFEAIVQKSPCRCRR
jgi:ABC-type transport system substrate-binding protein